MQLSSNWFSNLMKIVLRSKKIIIEDVFEFGSVNKKVLIKIFFSFQNVGVLNY